MPLRHFCALEVMLLPAEVQAINMDTPTLIH